VDLISGVVSSLSRLSSLSFCSSFTASDGGRKDWKGPKSRPWFALLSPSPSDVSGSPTSRATSSSRGTTAEEDEEEEEEEEDDEELASLGRTGEKEEEDGSFPRIGMYFLSHALELIMLALWVEGRGKVGRGGRRCETDKSKKK